MLAQWGLHVGKHFTRALGRRAKNVLQQVGGTARGIYAEGISAFDAKKDDRFREHTKERTDAAKVAVLDITEQIGAFSKTVVTAVRANPNQAAPQLAVLVITSVLVSGGPDGNGGAADLDLMFGIGAHRSIFSHSILMGAALEAGIYSLVDLVRIVHENLPAEHDPIWDTVYQQTEEFARAAQVGSSLGLAYP
jgi:hypothetical protein